MTTHSENVNIVVAGFAGQEISLSRAVAAVSGVELPGGEEKSAALPQPTQPLPQQPQPPAEKDPPATRAQSTRSRNRRAGKDSAAGDKASVAPRRRPPAKASSAPPAKPSDSPPNRLPPAPLNPGECEALAARLRRLDIAAVSGVPNANKPTLARVRGIHDADTYVVQHVIRFREEDLT